MPRVRVSAFGEAIEQLERLLRLPSRPVDIAAVPVYLRHYDRRVGGHLERNAVLPRAIPPATDVAGQRLLPQIEIERRVATSALDRRHPIWMATVDLPVPPL